MIVLQIAGGILLAIAVLYGLGFLWVNGKDWLEWKNYKKKVRNAEKELRDNPEHLEDFETLINETSKPEPEDDQT